MFTFEMENPCQCYISSVMMHGIPVKLYMQSFFFKMQFNCEDHGRQTNVMKHTQAMLTTAMVTTTTMMMMVIIIYVLIVLTGERALVLFKI